MKDDSACHPVRVGLQHGTHVKIETWYGCAQLLGEDAAKTSHFASYLREVFLPGTEMLTMEVAAATLGHLVKSGGALTADIVEFEVAAPGTPVTLTRSIGWAAVPKPVTVYLHISYPNGVQKSQSQRNGNPTLYT